MRPKPKPELVRGLTLASVSHSGHRCDWQSETCHTAAGKSFKPIENCLLVLLQPPLGASKFPSGAAHAFGSGNGKLCACLESRSKRCAEKTRSRNFIAARALTEFSFPFWRWSIGLHSMLPQFGILTEYRSHGMPSKHRRCAIEVSEDYARFDIG
jgi:hypothetical protein